MSRLKRPVPLFDNLENLKSDNTNPLLLEHPKHQKDFALAIEFIKQYDGSEATFRSYRREIERLLQWTWLVADKSILELKRQDIEAYIEFCKKPPKSWIGVKNVARFITKKGQRVPNSEWRIFVATVSKADFKKGIRADKAEYNPSQKSIREIFTVISSFYSHLINEGVMEVNPVILIRQKSKYFTTRQGNPKIPRLTETQWNYCIKVAEELAKKNPVKHERTLFIMTILYLMYLRISELVATERWQPQMGHFYKDSNKYWWFVTIGKGNKERVISVSDEMLAALKRYRAHLNLTPLPSPHETTSLLAPHRGKETITSTAHIRRVVQEVFDIAALKLRSKGHQNDANVLEHATVHWLRHTGISDDINMRGRPESHVRDDAGHSSILITDRYNDITLKERYLSGKGKSVRKAVRKQNKNSN